MISRLIPHPVRRLFGVKVNPSAPSYTLIDQPGSLQPLLDAIDRVDEVFLDTEADNMYHYRTRVCLLQIMADRDIFLVDVLAPGLKLDALWPRLAKTHLVMHGCDFDLRLLQSHCGFKASSIFDTMLAAQLLHRPRIGLAARLILAWVHWSTLGALGRRTHSQMRSRFAPSASASTLRPASC